MARAIYSRQSKAHGSNSTKSEALSRIPLTSVKRLRGFVQVPHPSQIGPDGQVEGFAGKRARVEKVDGLDEEEEVNEGAEEEEEDQHGNDDEEEDSDTASDAEAVAQYFIGFEQNFTPGMMALATITPFGSYKPLDARDVLYGRRLGGGPAYEGDSMREARFNKTIEQLRGHQAREIAKWTDSSEPAPPLRYCCYMPACAYSSNNKRELIRHFTQSLPDLHPGTNYEAALVFDVPHVDWMKDSELVCTGMATDTWSWYQEFNGRGFGPNRIEQSMEHGEDVEMDDAGGSELSDESESSEESEEE